MRSLAIYLDLDGVLADFDHGKRQLIGDSDADINHSMKFLSPELQAKKRELYAALQADADFYLNLPPMPGALEMYEALRTYSPVILTAAPRFGGDESGPHFLNAAAKKREWCRLHLGLEDDSAFICTTSDGKPKALDYRPGAVQVLVDDRAQNCAAWRRAGGVAIEHVSPKISLLRLYELQRPLLSVW